MVFDYQRPFNILSAFVSPVIGYTHLEIDYQRPFNLLSPFLSPVIVSTPLVIDCQRLNFRYHPRYIAGQLPHKPPYFVDFVLLLVDCQELTCLGTSQVLTD